jgi:hypothetical protein
VPANGFAAEIVISLDTFFLEGFQNYGSPGKRGIPKRESEF